MNFNMLNLAADTATTGNPAGGSAIMMIVIYALLFGALYLFMIRPQRKKQKEEKKMRENLQVGDEIVTIGGIHGRVISLKEETMVIESLSDHSKMTISRWALQANNTVHDDVPAK